MRRFPILAALAVFAIGADALAQTATPYAPTIQRVDLTATRGTTHGEALCLASAPVLVGGLAQRRSITVQNQGANSVTVCTSATCTLGTGLVLKTGEMLTLEVGPAIPVYCLAATADQVAGAGLRYVEVR